MPDTITELSGTPDNLLTRDSLLQTTAVGKILHKSPRTIENWRTAGKGPRFIKTGPRGVLYQYGDILDWCESRKVQSTSEELAA